MAGVVCTGSFTTLAALTEAAAPLGSTLALVPEPEPDTPGVCAGVCGRRFVPATAAAGPGETHEAARHLCSACYQAARNNGTLTPASARPTHCLGPCGLPLTTRTRRLTGHVIHEGGGWCVACARARSRTAHPEKAA